MTPFVMHLAASTPPPGGFPVVEATASSSEDALVTTHAVTLPSGVVSGNLILVAFNLSTTSRLAVEPTGWTLTTVSTTGGHTGFFHRVSDGSEGATLSFSTIDSSTSDPASTRSAHVSARVSGVDVGASPFIAIESAITNDSPSLTPSWGSAETLWFTFFFARASDWEVTPPADYTGKVEAKSDAPSSSSTRGGVVLAHRAFEGTNQTPGPWTVDTLGGMTSERTATVALRPL